jgi:hypothetical protein
MKSVGYVQTAIPADNDQSVQTKLFQVDYGSVGFIGEGWRCQLRALKMERIISVAASENRSAPVAYTGNSF